ncbi:hypothetical protein [Nocardioides currus]|uniref:Uncharacterized protein n=1 Tax=Nocardioides currus TaxID=2133958 RepID=A0A2R7YTM7_9ACTN|nr:hypothetical protein [Nocardioides currus]PUA79747.1 hypothetical protein C7S10_16810 [Nocardioides currus]
MRDDPSLERLSASAVRATVETLSTRIATRFPTRGLTRVAVELTRLAEDVSSGAASSRARLRWVRLASRIGVGLVVLATVAALVLAMQDAGRVDSSVDWLPLIESAINDLVFVAIAVFFLHALPNRIERGQLLGLLHRLRSLAHIVDMHQLTKDPERLRDDFVTTSASPDLDLDRSGMEHYLDYCSELLSLIGKVAALCAEESRDPLVLDTVSTIETLTTGMSRKIWQKISLLPD